MHNTWQPKSGSCAPHYAWCVYGVCCNDEVGAHVPQQLPAHYLLLKSHLMRESAKQPLTRQEARTLFRLEPIKALRVYDLLVASGCITARDPAQARGVGEERPA